MNTNLTLLIDNYDSFVFNLARYVEELGAVPRVARNDEITIEEIEKLAPCAIILSPGPCTPAEAGLCQEIVLQLGATIPILGVCLGHQAIAASLGGNIIRASEAVHGRASLIDHTEVGLFENCKNPLLVARYHSLIVEEASLPAELVVTARTEDGTIMALQHTKWPVFGVQFHPESILTNCGHTFLKNFLNRAGVQMSDQISTSDLPVREKSSPDFYSQTISQDAFRPL